MTLLLSKRFLHRRAVLIVSTPLRFAHTVTERFLRYVVIDTQSDPASPACPSTDKQKDLGRLLARELQTMGLTDAHLDEHGYVYATIPANTDKRIPVICFCSHMDTSPDCTGKNVGRRSCKLPAAPISCSRPTPRRLSALPTIPRSPTKSAMTSSPPTALHFSAPTTRP